MTIRSQSRHTRLIFEPLFISCSIACVTPASPLVQTSNSLLGEYEPDRELTPAIIRPVVEVSDRDGIFPEGNVNHLLALQSIKWLMNGKDITTLSEFAGKYEIVNDASAERGSLILHRNTPTTEIWTITFEAQFEDWRRGKIETVQSNTLEMYSSDLGSDIYGISIDKPIIEYNPVRDNLYIYEWMLAQGLIPAGNRELYKDERSYKQNITILVNSGTDELETLQSGLSLELLKNGLVVTPNSEQAPEITGIAYPTISLDLRCAVSGTKYDIKLKQDGYTLAHEAFSVVRKVSEVFEAYPQFSSDIAPAQENYVNRALVNLKDQTLTYPEIFFWIRWITQAMILNQANQTYQQAPEKVHSWGRLLDIKLKDIGIGLTKNDNYFTVMFDMEAHPHHSLTSDEDGNILTDEDGNKLIMQ